MNKKGKVLGNKFNKRDMNHLLIQLIYLKEIHLIPKYFNNIKH